MTWTEVTNAMVEDGDADKQWEAITSSSDGAKLAATITLGNTWMPSDSGATWNEITVGDGSNHWNGITSSSDGTKLAAVVTLGNIWRSSDSGATWTEVIPDDGLSNWDGIASSSDGTKLVAIKWLGNIFTSSDSGTTWTEVSFLNSTESGTTYWNGIIFSGWHVTCCNQRQYRHPRVFSSLDLK